MYSLDMKMFLRCGHHVLVKNMTRKWPKSTKLTECFILVNFKQFFCPFNARIIRSLYFFLFVIDSSLQIQNWILQLFMINLYFRPMRPFIASSPLICNFSMMGFTVCKLFIYLGWHLPVSYKKHQKQAKKDAFD